MKRQILLVLLLVTFSFTCSFAAKNNRYQFSNYPVSVLIPTWIKDMTMHQSKKGAYSDVEFSTGAGYWMKQGNYSVQLFPVPNTILDADSFYQKTEQYFKMYMVQDRKKMLAHLKLATTKKLNVLGYPAYQAIAIDSISKPAGIYVATSIYMKDYIAIVSLLTPYKPELSGSAGKQIPWRQYNQFMLSLK